MKRKKIHIFDVVMYSIMIFLTLIVLYPLIYMVSASFSDPAMVASGKVILFPKGISLAGYRRVLGDPDILRGYGNAIFYTVFGTLLKLFITLPAGYALSKSYVPGRNFIMKALLFTMYFGGGMIPTFLVVRSLGLYNTRTILLICHAFGVYQCIICRTFFQSTPRELEEAAYIDGSSIINTFVKIVLPVSKALIGVMVLYMAVGYWNSYWPAMIYTYDRNIQPLQLVLRRILIQEQTNIAALESAVEEYAAQQAQVAELIKYVVIVVASVPFMIVYPFLQKYFDQGVLLGSVKG